MSWACINGLLHTLACRAEFVGMALLNTSVEESEAFLNLKWCNWVFYNSAVCLSGSFPSVMWGSVEDSEARSWDTADSLGSVCVWPSGWLDHSERHCFCQCLLWRGSSWCDRQQSQQERDGKGRHSEFVFFTCGWDESHLDKQQVGLNHVITKWVEVIRGFTNNFPPPPPTAIIVDQVWFLSIAKCRLCQLLVLLVLRILFFSECPSFLFDLDSSIRANVCCFLALLFSENQGNTQTTLTEHLLENQLGLIWFPLEMWWLFHVSTLSGAPGLLTLLSVISWSSYDLLWEVATQRFDCSNHCFLKNTRFVSQGRVVIWHDQVRWTVGHILGVNETVKIFGLVNWRT